MSTIKEYLDYAELAQVAYGTLKVGIPDVKELDEGKAEFTTIQADVFSKRYKVIKVANSFITGLDAVLFYDEDNKKYILR